MLHQEPTLNPATQTDIKAPWQLDAEARIRQYKADDKAEELEREEKRKGDSNFIKVYPQGWKHLRELITSYPLAAKMYAFLAEHIDAGLGAVVVSQAFLAEELGVSDRTIRKLSSYLEDNHALVRIKIQGNLYAYALNPEEVWKSWKDHKDYAAFNTRTLARNKDNTDVKRRMNVILKSRKMPLLDMIEEEGQ